MPKVKRISMNFRKKILEKSYNFQTTLLLLKLLYNLQVPVSKKLSESRQNLPSHTIPTFISKSSQEGVATHKNCRASIFEISLLLYSKYYFTRNRRSVM